MRKAQSCELTRRNMQSFGALINLLHYLGRRTHKSTIRCVFPHCRIACVEGVRARPICSFVVFTRACSCCRFGLWFESRFRRASLFLFPCTEWKQGSKFWYIHVTTRVKHVRWILMWICSASSERKCRSSPRPQTGVRQQHRPERAPHKAQQVGGTSLCQRPGRIYHRPFAILESL